MKKGFVIAGAGIAGLTAAVALQRKGIDAIVYEAASQIMPLGAGLALAANAMLALRSIDLEHGIKAIGNSLSGLTICDHRQQTIMHTDAAGWGEKTGAGNFAIHRAALHEFLLGQLDAGQVMLNKRVVAVKQRFNEVTLSFADGTAIVADYLVAADGLHSPIRQLLLPGTTPRYAGYTCWRAVIPNPLAVTDIAREYWGPAGRFGITPIINQQLYWYACVNSTANNPQMQQMSAQRLLQNFKAYAPDVIKTLECTAGQPLIWNDIADIKPIRRFAFDNIVLIGDAAHATTPNMGQGACMAIEDAVILAREISRQDDVIQAFRQFETRRIQRTQQIVRTSHLLGRVSQWQNSWMIAARNRLFRMMPAAVNEKQLRSIYRVDLS